MPHGRARGRRNHSGFGCCTQLRRDQGAVRCHDWNSPDGGGRVCHLADQSSLAEFVLSGYQFSVRELEGPSKPTLGNRSIHVGRDRRAAAISCGELLAQVLAQDREPGWRKVIETAWP